MQRTAADQTMPILALTTGDVDPATARLARALRHANIAFFDYRSGPGDDTVGDAGSWHWLGSHFGIAGIGGTAGRARLADAVLETDREGLRRIFSLQEEARSRSCEVRMRAASGTTIHLYFEACSEAGPHGHPVAVVGIVRDVTDQRRFEVELDETVRRNHMLLATIDACPISITVADATQPDFPLIYVNRMFSLVTGYESGDVIGHNCRFLQGTATNAEVVAGIKQTVSAGAPTEIQVLNYRKDGGSFLNRLTLAPIHDDSGRLTAYIGLQSDVTQDAERRLAEDQRQKMEALGRMMGGVAHEINNMLQPVTLLGQDVIDKGLVVGEGLQHLEILLECSLKARHIIGDLLAFSRPTAGSVGVHDPVQLLNDSLRLVRQAVPPSVLLTVHIEGRPPQISIDRTAFTQILLNLVSNAAAAMEGRGEVTIVLDEHAARPAASVARLRVSDVGCGMDRITLDRAFEPFFTTKPIGQGTGLGLPVVYGLVRELGGTIALDSEPGRGTTATILLPHGNAPSQAGTRQSG